MKKQVVYIHGGESYKSHDDFLEHLRTTELWHMPKEGESSGGKWTSSLQDELGDEYEVILPPMPNKQNAKFEEWKIWFERHFEYLHDGVILMGCSLGAMFLAKYLITNDLPFKPNGIILMAGAYRLTGFDDTDCADFLVTPNEVSVLNEKYHNIVIMHSEDDFVVPFEHGVALSQALPNAEFVVYKDKNHFLIEEFPEIINKIKAIS